MFAVECYDAGDGLCVVSGGERRDTLVGRRRGRRALTTFDGGARVGRSRCTARRDARRIVSGGKEGVQVWDAVAGGAPLLKLEAG